MGRREGTGRMYSSVGGWFCIGINLNRMCVGINRWMMVL